MILADIDINLIILLIAGVIALVRWLTTKDEPEAPPAPPPQRSARTPAGPAPEEERMRKFLEALGVPTEVQPPPRPQAQAPQPQERRVEPPPLHRPQQYPSPPVVYRPERRRKPARVPEPPPLVQTAPAPQSLDELSEPVFPVEPVDLPASVAFPAATSVATVASAFPGVSSRRAELESREARTGLSGNPQLNELRQLFQSPKNLRSAIILREILGPPRSLQTGSSVSNFP